MLANVRAARRWTGGERALVVLVAATIALVIFFFGTPFRAEVGVLAAIGAWLPLLARQRRTLAGHLALDDEHLVVKRSNDVWRIPLEDVRAVHAQAGRRGASVLIGLDDGVLAASVDDPVEAARFAARLRPFAVEGDDVKLALGVWPRLELGLRAAVTAAGVGFGLAVGLGVLPHATGILATAMTVLGALLAALYMVPLMRWSLTEVADLGVHGAALQAHLEAHAADGEGVERELDLGEVIDAEESLAGFLERLRAALDRAEPYRADAPVLQERLEHLVEVAAAPAAKRALALRVVATGDAGALRERVRALPTADDEERAWLEEVALAESDDEALRLAEGRAPRYVP